MNAKRLKVERVVYRNEHNLLSSKLVVVLADGQRMVPSKRLGFVWRSRVWADGVSRYSRGELVFEYDGRTWRMGAKSAVPLVLADGERLEPVDFAVGAAFVV